MHARLLIMSTVCTVQEDSGASKDVVQQAFGEFHNLLRHSVFQHLRPRFLTLHVFSEIAFSISIKKSW